jgi:VHL beta domain
MSARTCALWFVTVLGAIAAITTTAVARDTCPGDSVRDKRGQCVKEDEPVRANPCSGGRLYSLSRRVCHCPENLPVWTGRQCIVAKTVSGPVPSSNRPATRSCSQQRSLRSVHSRERTQITFVNNSGAYRSLMWIDFKGQFIGYDGLNSGTRKTIDTFRTHPWISATGPGDCVQIFLPSAGPGTVFLK